MNHAAISADIVASTSLGQSQREILDTRLREFLCELRAVLGMKKFFGRLVKGDCLEFVLDEPQQALRVALMIRTFVKALEIKSKNSAFNNYGARVAVGIGGITALDRKRGFIDGPAIVFSGRALQEMGSRNKTGLAFRSANNNWNNSMTPLFALLDTMLVKSTKQQCGILLHRLSGKTVNETSAITGTSVSNINKQLRASGWSAIESALRYFEEEIK